MVLIIGKKEWPFKVTPALKKLVKKAHVNLAHVGKGSKNEVRRLAYLTAKASAEADKLEFGYKFEDFMQLVEPGHPEKTMKIATQLVTKATKKEVEKELEAEKEPAEKTKK
jgi:hypothetical protein